MARIEVFYSLQSDYCYFLLDRLIALSDSSVEVEIRPVLGGVIRVPERFLNRDQLEQEYFKTDTERTAEYLGLPYAYPDPSPIEFNPDSVWIANPNQPLNEYINRLYVGAAERGKALAFLNFVGRMLWDGSTPGWNQDNHLANAMTQFDLTLESVLADTPWDTAKAILDTNAERMLNSGHWGVPLMVYNDEPFYGQDRFDQMVWRMQSDGVDV